MFLAKRTSRMAGMGSVTTDIQAYITSVFNDALGRDPREQGLDFYTQAVLNNSMTPEQIRAEIIANAAPEIQWRTAAATGAALPDANDYQEQVWAAAATDSIPEPLADWGVAVPAPAPAPITTTTRYTAPETRTASAAQIAAAQVNQQLERLDEAGTDTTDLRTSFQTLTQQASDETGISKPVLIGGGVLALLYLLKK